MNLELCRIRYNGGAPPPPLQTPSLIQVVTPLNLSVWFSALPVSKGPPMNKTTAMSKQGRKKNEQGLRSAGEIGKPQTLCGESVGRRETANKGDPVGFYAKVQRGVLPRKALGRRHSSRSPVPTDTHIDSLAKYQEACGGFGGTQYISMHFKPQHSRAPSEDDTGDRRFSCPRIACLTTCPHSKPNWACAVWAFTLL